MQTMHQVKKTCIKALFIIFYFLLSLISGHVLNTIHYLIHIKYWCQMIGILFSSLSAHTYTKRISINLFIKFFDSRSSFLRRIRRWNLIWIQCHRKLPTLNICVYMSLMLLAFYSLSFYHSFIHSWFLFFKLNWKLWITRKKNRNFSPWQKKSIQNQFPVRKKSFKLEEPLKIYFCGAQNRGCKKEISKI